jgi:alpha-beta hydrolase superfamily lysophospholipase
MFSRSERGSRSVRREKIRKWRWLRRSLRVFVLLFVLLNIMAAFHAYKLTHNHPGSFDDHKGPDKMSFPQKVKALFFGVWSLKTPVKDHPAQPYEVVTMQTSNELKIEAWLIKKDSSLGTVIMFHGHMGNKGAMLPEASMFYAMGYSVMLVDFRAHGNSEGSASTIGKREGEDVKLAYDYMVSQGEKNIVLWGTSMGAAAICSAFNSYELSPAGVILEMPFGSLHDAVRGRVRMMGLPKEPVSSLLTFWGGVEQGFWAFAYRPGEYAKKIRCRALLQWGALDIRVTRKETEAIYENLASTYKKLEIYPRAGHASLFNNDSLQWKNAVTAFLQ